MHVLTALVIKQVESFLVKFVLFNYYHDVVIFIRGLILLIRRKLEIQNENSVVQATNDPLLNF